MRYWIILLMIALAIPLLPITRTSLRSTASVLGRFIPAPSNSTTISYKSQRNTFTSSVRTTSDQSSNMATSSIPASDPLATSKVAEPVVVEEKLPKLSAAEFKMYNKQADMMQYYVSSYFLVMKFCIYTYTRIYIYMLSVTFPLRSQTKTETKHNLTFLGVSAQPLPPNMAHTLQSLRIKHPTQKRFPKPILQHRSPTNPPFDNTPRHRRNTYISRSRTTNARIRSIDKR